MARITLPLVSSPAPARLAAGPRPVSRLAFDGAFVALCAWYLGGLYLDGWAHQHIPQMETFFTPWHAVLYSGFAATAGLLFLVFLRNRLRGYSWQQALPVGYELSLAGAIIFAVGGVGDLIWHSLFGIEADVEALLSPTHLVLATGMVLILTGPLRAAWHRDQAGRGWPTQLPMLLSLTFTLALFTFFTQYAHPFGETFPDTSHRPPTGNGDLIFFNQALGIISILLQSGILMGFILLAVRRWSLPFGSLTLVFGLHLALLVWMRNDAVSDLALAVTGPYPLIAAALLAGFAADVLLVWLRPSAARPAAFRLFAFLVPVILYALYFLTLEFVGGGIWWSIHLWAGVIVLSGIVGFLLSYAFAPPAAV